MGILNEKRCKPTRIMSAPNVYGLVNYYVHPPLMITKENIKIEYDFSKDDVISCETVSK